MIDISNLTVDQQLIANAAGDIAKGFPHSYFLEEMKAGEFPTDFWKVLAGGGYLGVTADEEHGGAGLSAYDATVFMSALAKGGLGSNFLISHVVCIDAINRFGTDDQKAAHIPEMVKGSRWTYADTERTDGKTLFFNETKAEKDGDGYKLTGTKRYIVGAEGATHMLVAARTGNSSDAYSEDDISVFIVPTDADGVTLTSKEINVRVSTDREPISANGDAFFEVTLDGVVLGADQLLGEAVNGAEIVKTLATTKMLHMAAIAIGWGDRIIDQAVDYANGRAVFEEPIASYQAIQHPMVLAKTEVEMSKLMLERAAQEVDESDDLDERLMYAALAKHQATEASNAACDIGIQSHGGSGFDRDNGLITLWPLIHISRILPLNSATILERFAEVEYELPTS